MIFDYIEQRSILLGQGSAVNAKEWKKMLIGIHDKILMIQNENIGFVSKKLAYFDIEDGRNGLQERLVKYYTFKNSLSAFKRLYDIQHPTEERKQYDHLISMVGLSLEPIMHTILTLYPKHITLCVTKQSKEIGPEISTIDFVRKAIMLFRSSPDYSPIIETLIIDNSNTAKIFVEVNRKIKTLINESKIVALDITGGKKSMDITAFLAATMYQNIDIYYVDFDGYEENGPIYGTEFLNKLLNPYHFFSIQDKKLIKDLWDRKRYREVVIRLDDLLAEDKFGKIIAEDYKLVDERVAFENLQKAAACYDAWQQFDYNMAESKCVFIGYEIHKDSLKELSQCDQSVQSPKDALLLAIDKYIRGIDAKKLSDWDKATIYFSQSVEILISFTFWDSVQKGILVGDNVKSYKFGDYKSMTTMLGVLFGKFGEKKLSEICGTQEAIIIRPIFTGNKIYERLRNIVINNRNEIAHYTSYQKRKLETEKKEILLQEICRIVDNFMSLYANKYECIDTIENYKILFAFPSIDHNLNLCVLPSN